MALTKYNCDGFHYWAPVKKHGGWIAYKSSPSAPAAPDPAATAAAQTQSNIATANANANLNRTSQVTPWGNLTYSHGDTANPDGTYNWTATTQLSPAQQRLLDSSNNISQSMADLGQTQLNNVANTATRPLDFSSLQPAIVRWQWHRHGTKQLRQRRPDPAQCRKRWRHPKQH